MAKPCRRMLCRSTTAGAWPTVARRPCSPSCCGSSRGSGNMCRGSAFVDPSGGVSQRSEMAEEEGGRIGRVALPTATIFDGVEPRDRWGDAHTRPMSGHAASARARSSDRRRRLIGHFYTHARPSKKFGARSRWAVRVGFHRRAGIAVASRPLLPRRSRRTTVRAAVGRVPGYRP